MAQLFAKKSKVGVRSFLLKLVNNQCAEMEAMQEGPRVESRVRLSVVTLVVPVIKHMVAADKTFPAVTKEFSTAGVSLIINEPKALEDVILGFRYEGRMTYLRGSAKYLNPLGAGFYQLGVELTEIAHPGDYPGLGELSF